MASKGIASSILLLRILTLLLSAASVAVLITDTIKFSDGSKTSFNDIVAYRFVLSTAAIGAAYSLLQLPFAIYYACTEKRLIRGRFLPEFDFYGDKIIGALLATGVGAGFAVTFESKLFVRDFVEILAILGFQVPDDFESVTDRFLNRVYIASGLLLGGFICMVLLSILSSINRRSPSGFFK